MTTQEAQNFTCLYNGISPAYIKRFRVVLLVMLKPSVLLPTDAVSWEDGKGTKRCMATAAPNINKEIIKGISLFLIRDFFSDEVSLLLS